MVRELHQLGFERLRVPAYEYPLAWRCLEDVPPIVNLWQRVGSGFGCLIQCEKYGRV